jgi:hypothetical protein
MPAGSNPTLAQLKTYVALLYGYLYSDGNLTRVYNQLASSPRPDATPGPRQSRSGRATGAQKQGGDDKDQYDAYEAGVLLDLMCAYRDPREPPFQLPSSPAAQLHDEHAHTLREEYKEYRLEALDAFELAVLVNGELRRLHPPPGSGDQQRLTGLEWDKQTLAELAGHHASGQHPTIHIVVSSKVDACLALHYLAKAQSNTREVGQPGFLGTNVARAMGRTRHRPLLSRCLYARALCMLIESDAATAVRARREQLKRAAERQDEPLSDELEALGFSDLGSQELVAYFHGSAECPELPVDDPACEDAFLPTCFGRAEAAFCAGMGLADGETRLVDTAAAGKGHANLRRLCNQLDRRYEYAAIRHIGIPERQPFLMGLSLGLGFAWCTCNEGKADYCQLVTFFLAGCLALVLASRYDLVAPARYECAPVRCAAGCRFTVLVSAGISTRGCSSCGCPRGHRSCMVPPPPTTTTTATTVVQRISGIGRRDSRLSAGRRGWSIAHPLSPPRCFTCCLTGPRNCWTLERCTRISHVSHCARTCLISENITVLV